MISFICSAEGETPERIPESRPEVWDTESREWFKEGSPSFSKERLAFLRAARFSFSEEAMPEEAVSVEFKRFPIPLFPD